MNYVSIISTLLFIIFLTGCCGSVELTERIVKDEVHIVPADTFNFEEYIDTSGNVTDDYEPLHFEPNPECDTAAIISKYANLNIELKKKNANLWFKFKFIGGNYGNKTKTVTLYESHQ